MHDLAIERIEKNRVAEDPSLNLGNSGLQEFPTQILEHTWLEDLIFVGKHCTKTFAMWADRTHDALANKKGGADRFYTEPRSVPASRRKGCEESDPPFSTGTAGDNRRIMRVHLYPKRRQR